MYVVPYGWQYAFRMIASHHANQSCIHQFDMNDKNNCLYSSDVISFAREKGYFTGVNKDFSFADAYAPLDFGGVAIAKPAYGAISICLPIVVRGFLP